jgi:uncharacterized membrane protein YkvA (DUF1232 family)
VPVLGYLDDVIVVPLPARRAGPMPDRRKHRLNVKRNTSAA